MDRGRRVIDTRRRVHSFQDDEARDNRSARPKIPNGNHPSTVATVMSTDVSNVRSNARSTGP